MNMNFSRGSCEQGGQTRKKDGDCSYSQGLSTRVGRVPLLLRQAMLEEEVTSRGGLKRAAHGEQGRQAEGTAAGTPR